MNDDLRNSLWNVLDAAVWSSEGFLYLKYGTPGISPFSRELWSKYFKKPTDARPADERAKLREIRKYFFQCEWHEVYDFIEFSVNFFSRSMSRLSDMLNVVLERELSGYRIVAGHVVDITSEQEVQML